MTKEKDYNTFWLYYIFTISFILSLSLVGLIGMHFEQKEEINQIKDQLLPLLLKEIQK